MPQWLLDSMQYVHLAVFAVASISVEWRRPGLILAAFALLYMFLSWPLFPLTWPLFPFSPPSFGGSSINTLLRDASSPLFMLMWVGLDLLGGVLILRFCYPSKENKSFHDWQWIAVSGLIIGFSFMSFLNYCYTMGYIIAMPTPVYDIVSMLVGLILPTLFLPGILGGAYEVKRFALEKRARGPVPVYWVRPLSDWRDRSGGMAGLRNVFHRDMARLSVAHGPHEINRGEKQ